MTRLHISGLSHDLRGVAHADGLVWFVDGALPGEDVKAQEISQRQNTIDAETIEVEHASAIRVAPTCEYYAVCGGCTLQHVSHEGQLSLKQQAVLDQLNRMADVQPNHIVPAIVSRPWEYRRRARLSVKWSSETKQLSVGFRQRKGHRISNIEHCAVLEPALQALLVPIRDCLLVFSSPGKLGHVDIASVKGRLAMSLRITGSLPDKDIDHLRVFSDARAVAVYLQQEVDGDTQSTLIAGAAVSGQRDSKRDGAGPDFIPGDFLQGNAEVNDKLIQAVILALEAKPEDRLFEAFCGSGNFTFPLANIVNHVSAFEIDQGMVDRATVFTSVTGLSNVFFCAMNLDVIDPKMAHLPVNLNARINLHIQNEAVLVCNKMLLDPPRAGAKIFCESVSLKNIERIVYVSCNPSTLARDAGILKERGWQMESIQIIDMFPQTFHVEVLAVFVPQAQRETAKTRLKTVAKGRRIKPFSIR